MEAKTSKVCNRCHKELPVEMFSMNRRRPDGLQIYCKSCKSEMAKIYNAKRKQKTTPPTIINHTTADKPEYAQFQNMQHREIIAEIRLRLNYLRANGWHFDGKLEYTQTKTVIL